MKQPLESTVEIRLARPSDAMEIALMSREHIEEGLPWKWTPERVTRAIRTPNMNVAIAQGENALLGFGIMSYVDSVAHLVLLAIHDDHRRKGLGTVIVEWLEKVARTAGIELIRCEARADNVAALALYAAFGYRQRERITGMYYGIDDGIRLEKVLTTPSADWLVSLLQGATTLDLMDVITDGYARFAQCRDGVLIYVVTIPTTGQEYSFPVPLGEGGAGSFEAVDRAIVFMPFIRKAIAEGTFLPYSK